MKQMEMTTQTMDFTMQQGNASAVRSPIFGRYIMHMYEDMRRSGKKNREDDFMREQFEIIDDYIEQA